MKNNNNLFYLIKKRTKIIIYSLFAKQIANRMYKNKFGRDINWTNPVEFNEKIRYIQFFTDTSLWITLADKWRVRQYIEQKGLPNILVKLYGVWQNPMDIDFSQLPSSFVLKTNNGCGDALVIKNKNDISEIKIKKMFYEKLSNVFGLNSAQIHYAKIKGCVIAEELLVNDCEYSSSIVDYKFYCFNGEPKFCGVFYDRKNNTHNMCVSFYDMQWNKHDEWKSTSYGKPSIDFPKPERMADMVDICKSLTKGIPFVRLDLYYINNKIYFGEYTFTPASCCGGSLNPLYFNYFGSLIKL